ncbi:MAG: hypothetical protein GOMPHAMPRED_006972 [Gomphillus americanus]|uniref:Luciferase domain-containing protein n=1 Tax=Gomphillus americanus TaxID=1940652 RepID=A0A8H3I9L3_9LECA|nr:MAG: hypothetical protein GOMPHAMPRED_006972 [Gomphillus americanus]
MATKTLLHFPKSLFRLIGSLQDVMAAFPVQSTAAALCLAMLVRRVNKDYRAWYNLGPGGCSHNILGYIFSYSLTLLSSRDIKQTFCYEPLIAASPSLSGIPIRAGAPPVVSKWMVPVRQLSARASEARLEEMEAMVHEIAAKHDLVFTAPSIIEGGHSPALYIQANHLIKGEVQNPAREREVFHFHESEGSVHVTLSPADAKYVLDRGWGQRHPLSGYFGMGFTYVMIYSPRNDEELDVLRKITYAAIDYALERRKLGGL